MELDELTQTWIEYRVDRDQTARNRLAEHYQPVVRYVAAKIGSGLPSMVERDDLISYGNFGLLDALKKFDVDKGVKFETYAVSRIRGAILDELRSLDWVPRTVRSKARDVERATTELHHELGRPPEDPELAAYLGISLKELWNVASQQAMSWISDLNAFDDDSDRQSISDYAFDPASNPEDLLQVREIGNLLADAIDGMSGRAKIILSLYYCQEMTLAEIATVLGVTVSRVCQIQSKLLQQLREELGHGAAQMVA